MLIENTASYKNMLRMSYSSFINILSKMKKYITLKEIGWDGNKVISPAERLTLTLRFLVTKENYKSLSFQFRVSSRAISRLSKCLLHYYTKITRYIL